MRYTPYKDELYNYQMLLRIHKNPSFRRIFKIDITKRFLTVLWNTARERKGFVENTVLSIHGPTGGGKSISAYSLGKMLFPHFKQENIFFFDEEIKQQAQNFPKNTLIIRDENPMKAIRGQGSLRSSSEFTVLSETCRKAGLNLALIEPSFQENPITKFYLETVDMDVKRRITRLAIRDAVTLDFIGAVYLRVVPESDPGWIAYNLRKDTFIDSMKAMNFRGGRPDLFLVAKQVMEMEEFYKYRKKAQRRAFVNQNVGNLTIAETKDVLELIEVELENEEK